MHSFKLTASLSRLWGTNKGIIPEPFIWIPMTATDSYLIFLKNCFRQLVHILENTAYSFLNNTKMQCFLNLSCFQAIHCIQQEAIEKIYFMPLGKKIVVELQHTFHYGCTSLFSCHLLQQPSFSCALLGSMCNRHFNSSVCFLTQPPLKKKFCLSYRMWQLSGGKKTKQEQKRHHPKPIRPLWVWRSSLFLNWCTNYYVSRSSNPWGEAYRRYSLERMPGEHKLHGWMVGTIANISCWGGWEWIMHVLGKQLPHSGVEGVKRVSVGGTFLIKLEFLINNIVCVDPEDTVWWENNVQISKG